MTAPRLTDQTNATNQETFYVRLATVLDQYHPTITVRDLLQTQYARYAYRQEQLALNQPRSGFNLVDPETTRHILQGEPIYRIIRAESPDQEDVVTTTVKGWAGGHANPNAKRYGKSQIPDFWTGERFMYEVSDILLDANSKWIRQETTNNEQNPTDAPERYVCTEKRYGVPIRVVAEKVDGQMVCVTAFPDYKKFPIDDVIK
ncbi:MAG: hypothetical protein Q4G03_06715 [Planctomycetia bacterium]|nr:hypothetical protein [Planctomycetia bacterium]